MGPELVIALYKPRRNKSDEFHALLATHEDALRQAALVTERPFTMMQSADGTILEIFEWRDRSSSAKAHDHPELGPLWGAMAEIADFPCMAELPEATKRFPHFAPAGLG